MPIAINNGAIEINKRHDWPRPRSLKTCNLPNKYHVMKHMLVNETKNNKKEDDENDKNVNNL